ncbi:MAG: solute carrier family 26 protein [Bacteroidota bacterium]
MRGRVILKNNSTNLKRLQKTFPLLKSLKGYQSVTFKKDVVAGLTVGVMLVPQGMAYALLAGMPPIYGLYAGLVPLILYAFLGSSRHLAIGPVAVSSLLVYGGISQIAEPQTATYISLVVTAGLLIGLMELALSTLKLGFLVNFLSHPVIAGFTSAAAVIIGISQLEDLLGFEIPNFPHPIEKLGYALQHLDQINWLSFTLCVGTILLIYGMRYFNRNLPGGLIVVTIGTLLSWRFDLVGKGLNIVGAVPEGLPFFKLPDLQWTAIQQLIPTVLTVTVIGVVESLSIAKVIGAKHPYYTVKPNQELLALGIAKIGGAFFQSMPTSGSFTRSAINNESGAQTTVASIITALSVGLTLIFLTPLFYYLPMGVLAGIILLAVKSLFDYEEAIHLWHVHRADFVMLLLTFLVTLAVSIPIGILTGVLLSAGASLYRSSKPHIAILGNIPQTTHYRNIERFPHAQQLEHKLIMRFDDQLYFANASFFKDTVRRLLKESGRNIRYFYLDATNIHDLDSSGLHALKEVYYYLRKKDVQLCICGATGPVRDLLFKSGLMEEIGKENNFVYIHTAHQFHLKQMGEIHEEIASETDALQTNFSRNRRIIR